MTASTFRSESSKLPQLSKGLGSLLLSSQLCEKPVYPAPGTSLKGQTGIVIGGNAGLGLESASMLIGLDLSNLIVTTRSETKGEATVNAISTRHPNSGTKVEFLIVDLSSYESIQGFVNRCQQLARIDFVILNAGMTSESHRLTKYTGHEELVQINYLSPMLLTTLMLPVLKAKAPAGRPGRITVVNSGTAMHAKFPQHAEPSLLAALDSKDNYRNNATAANQYSLSKFLCHLYFDKLYQYVSADDVVINLVDPGLTKGTELHRNINGALASQVLGGMKAMIGRTLEVGASTYIHAAITMGKQSHGSYIMDWRIYPYGEFYYHENRKDVQQTLWNETMEEFKFANVESILSSMQGNA